MSKLLTSLRKAVIATIIIHLVSYTAIYLFNDFDYQEVVHSLPITLSHFFIAPFLSFYFFNEHKKLLKDIIKPSLIAFTITYLLFFVWFRVFNSDLEFTFFELASMFNGVISFFIALFFTLIQRINVKSRVIKGFDFKKLKYSYSKLFLIAFSGVLIYLVMILVAGPVSFPLSQMFLVTSKFLPLGFILSILSIHFFNYVFAKYQKPKRSYYIVFYYILTISFIVFWIVLSANNFRLVKDGIGATLDRLFLLQGIVLYSPYFLYVLVLTHLYFLSLVNKKEKEVLNQKSLESQLNYQQLKNQLSPHFLFNNINVLTSLIEENPQKAVAFSSKLANIYRYFLEQQKQDVIVLKDELNFAKDYIELLQNRFENGLEFSINTSEESNTKYIVATSLQQILENVIKHNEVSKDHKITISITDKDDYLIVSNNKNPKIADVKSNQNGLKNIKKRYAYFSDKKVEITQDKHQFSIQLPLLTL